MIDYSFNYKSDSLNLDQVSNAGLFIKAGRADFSFLIAENGRLLAWKDKCAVSELSDNAQLAYIIQLKYKQVTVGIAPDALTLVPSAVFTQAHAGDYARFLDVKADDMAYAAKLDADNEIIYKTDHTFIAFLLSRVDTKVSVPADRGWIDTIAKTEPNNHTLYMDCTDGRITLLNFNGGKVRFYNVFDAETADDIIYYSLFAASRLDMQPDYTSVVVSGHIAAGDFAKLSEFFRTVKYNDTRVLEIPTGVPAHQILSLSTLA